MLPTRAGNDRRCRISLSQYTELREGVTDFIYPSSFLKETRQVALFPGSFNPIHDAHREVFRIASEYLDSVKVYYEVSINRLGKGFLSYEDLNRILSQFDKEDVVVTNLPLISEKVEKLNMFSIKPWVILGSDNYDRLCLTDKPDEISCSFLLIFRDGHRPANISSNCETLEMDRKYDGISSTRIRQRNNNESI